MLKRLIPTLLFNNNNLVKDKNFKSERGGNSVTSCKNL